MENRRAVLALGGILAAAPFLRARAADAVFAGKPTADTPRATVIPGKPPVLDFGDGLKIPCDKSAFLTLWEGKTFWLTFGAGRSTYAQRAAGEAVLYASGAMKLLLMTLAFAPERLEQKDGGWRLKVQDTQNFVLGDIELPGVPYWPITDADLTGFGDLASPSLNSPPASGASGAGRSNPWNPSTSSLSEVSAFTAYIVMKKDVSLDYVRVRAQLLTR